MKNIIALFIALTLALTLCVGFASAEADTYKVGMTFNLGNLTWAELCTEAKTYGESLGMEVTVVDNGDKAATQVSQIENFTQSGMDCIIICAVESSSVAEACKNAMDAGIRIIGYTQELQYYDAEYLVDPYNTGYACGQAAAAWINEHYGDAERVEWALQDLPKYPEIIERANGIKDGIEQNTTNTVLVATAAAEIMADGVTNAETFMQAHPDIKVITSIGSGGGAGANEGVKAYINEEDYPEFGIFGIDATEQEILNIIKGDPQKSSVSLGGGAAHADAMIDMAYNFWKGIDQEPIQYMPITVIDATNAQEYYDTHF